MTLSGTFLSGDRLTLQLPVSSASQATISVLLPDLGESVTEGVVVEWRKSQGDRVEAGETLLDVTTDKVDVEIPAPSAGRLARQVVQPGDVVAVGALLGEIETEGAADGDGAGPAPQPARDEAVAEPSPPAPPAPSADGGERLVPIVLPPMESVTEATIVEWRRAVGDAVRADEVVVEVTTDKVDLEVPAPAEGRLASILAQPGETIAVGQPLGEIAVGAAADAGAPPGDDDAPTGKTFIAAGAADAPAPGAVDGDRALAPPAAAPPEPDYGADEPAPAATPGEALTASDGTGPATTPLARRLAAHAGVDLRTVTGNGPGGLVRRSDVEAFLTRRTDGAARTDAAAPAPATAAAPPPTAPAPVPSVPGERAVPLKGPPAALAGYMQQSLTIPTATSFRTIAVSELDRRRRDLNTALANASREEKLSYTHLIAWAIVKAVASRPAMGNAYSLVDGAPHRLERDFVNLGLAVDVERRDGTRSLLVPVVRDAAALGFRGFRDAYDDLVGRTRSGRIGVDDLQAATVSLTNPGGLGTVASVPRLMPGQGTIVATGSIGYPPGFTRVGEERLRELGVEKVMTMTSTYDHRVIQGAESGAFLAEIEAMLRGEGGFYEEVAESLGVQLGAAAPDALELPSPPAAPKPEIPAAAHSPAPALLPAAAPTSRPRVGVDLEFLHHVGAAVSVVKAHRTHGHLAARLDPLGAEPVGDPALEPAWVGLTPTVMARIPAEVLRVFVPGDTFADALPHLRETYCGTIAYEVEHIASHQKRVWLREHIEAGRHRTPLAPDERIRLLERLVEVDVFERFLRRTYLGQKTFSIEGLDALIPILDETIELCSDAGAAEIVLGMAHRGRLAAITHVVGRPPESILAEFEGHVETTDLELDEEIPESAGDVKYHLGADGTYLTRSGRAVAVTLMSNPSHLEQVNAVAEGRTRARQTIRRGHEAYQDPTVAVPVLVHGDASFPGQGAVAETLNLQALPGYTTGGTIHVIANNQIGFTTDTNDARSSRHASDLAKGFDVPVIHVNADDVEACIAAVRLAASYRERFRRDVLIDLIGYRRLGHNEVDEPAYTQPVMARTIKAHQPVSRIYGDRLVGEGVIGKERLDAIVAAAERRMTEAHRNVTSQFERGSDLEPAVPAARASQVKPVKTGVTVDTLISLNEQLLSVPAGFTLHPKLAPQLERRRTAMTEEKGIVWAHAEALALASLLTEGVPVRLTGQDAARGTFSHRHLELHDVAADEPWQPFTGRVYTPMQHLLRASASFELHNSPLSEAAAVGFEYGYSCEAPETLVLWEAQYGDFANGAQIMIDQFIASGQAKWGQASRLTMLLPHGYEGNGPEHSSARVERFLQLAAEGNLRIANCTTAAQYFHLLRKQALMEQRRPLILFTPKSLLRLRGASSRLEDLVTGHFAHVLDDPRIEAGNGNGRDAIRRLLLCTGKVFHELDAHPERDRAEDLAIVRIEMLYPFPQEDLREVIESYPRLTEVSWVQEEPRNMGAWDRVARRISRALPDGIELGYVGRPPRASPSEGYPQAHQAEQERLLAAALGGVTSASR
jgi:2-oxoglutarate dehydrogenase E1 component